MKAMRCWFLHRRYWTVIRPGLLPLDIDALAFCPICDKGGARPLPTILGAISPA